MAARDPDTPAPQGRRRGGLTRRGLLGGAGGAFGALAAGGAGFALASDAPADGSGTGDGAVPFRGVHQAGIATAAQDRLVFGAFDLLTDDAAQVRDVLRAWTAAAEKLAQGLPVGTLAGNDEEPPEDTGEAQGLPAAQLTLTFGFGPTFFEKDGEDRLGLRARRPKLLRPLGPLPGDEVDDDRSGGDLCVQACSNDPMVAFHAIRNLNRIGRGVVALRWTQLGFGKTSTTTRGQATPRNLMGFKDGTNNIRAEDTATMARHVWVGREEPQAWMRGGSYLVARRIRMLIESWDRDRIADQEAVIGRRKVSGAPIGRRDEFDPLDLKAADGAGQTLVPPDAHVRLAAPETNGGIQILRRGYSYTDGIDPVTGQLDAGLFFIAYQRDPAQFVTLQRKLGVQDALNEYIKHVGSGLFAVAGGVRPGQHIAEGLFTGLRV